LALTALSIERERDNFKQELLEQANLFLKTTTLSIRDSLYSLELDELIDLARVLRDDPDVTFFVVYDSNGRTLVDSNTEQIATFSLEIDRSVKNDRHPEKFTASGRRAVADRQLDLDGNQSIGAIATGMSTPCWMKNSLNHHSGHYPGPGGLIIGGADRRPVTD
jgi:hypothetical protein